jgi:hypothetical protein
VSRGGAAAPLAAAAALVAAALWLGARQDRAAAGAAGDARAAAAAGGPGAGVAALPVRAVDGAAAGRAVSLATLGTPAVAMVVSTGCGVCKAALADFGRLRAGRPLPRLWLVTLEGAERGPAMTRAAGVAGAVHAGPASPAQEALFTFAIAGTPTFVAVDAAGRVRGVLPGYPGAEAMAGWLRVMAGEAEAP